ncbi:hypothetical protein F183_A52970 [Bryobacterales bacterium F-183]|nr:hypothetical protein F183_A52970 [Bryobacterales bacterium F-183]
MQQRRHFLTTAILAAPASQLTAADPSLYPEFPRQSPTLVREMLVASHGNLAKVKDLLKLRPALANAAWDWGFGDWETALAAAAHMGNRDIAEELLAAGAQPTLFSAAMLGQAAVVKAMLDARPELATSLGAHGIPLIAHAKGEALAYLKTVPAANQPEPARTKLTEEQLTQITGAYQHDLTVTRKNTQLFVTRTGSDPRMMIHDGNLQFHPTGARAVSVHFENTTGGATPSIVIQDGDLTVRAARLKQ